MGTIERFRKEVGLRFILKQAMLGVSLGMNRVQPELKYLQTENMRRERLNGQPPISNQHNKFRKLVPDTAYLCWGFRSYIQGDSAIQTTSWPNLRRTAKTFIPSRYVSHSVLLPRLQFDLISSYLFFFSLYVCGFRSSDFVAVVPFYF